MSTVIVVCFLVILVVILAHSHSVACSAGQFADTTTDQTRCSECAEGEYSAGGTVRSCTRCPGGKSVEQGKGTQASDCHGKSAKKLNLEKSATVKMLSDELE